MTDQTEAETTRGITGAELLQFIERYERLQAEKDEVADQQKEVMAEARGRGFDVKILRKLIAMRKREAAEIAEEDALLELYRGAIGL